MNHDIEFIKLQKRLKNVRSLSERIVILERITTLSPRDSKYLSLRRRYKGELDNSKIKASIKKPAAFNVYGVTSKYQVVLVGQTNTGKSTLHNLLTDSKEKTLETPFTTYKPAVGVMDCQDVPVQIVEVPPVYSGDVDSEKYKLIRNTNVLCICTKSPEDYFETIANLEDYLLMLTRESPSPSMYKERPLNEIIEKPAFVASWDKEFYQTDLPLLNITDTSSISACIFSLLNLKRIYSFVNGQVEGKPTVFPLEQDVSIEDFVKRLDKRLLKVYRGKAKITGLSAKYNGQIVGFNHLVEDGDRVELIK